MQQTAADGFSLAEGTRRELGRAFNFQADIRRNPYTFTSHHSPGIHEFSDTPATSRDRSEHREKQAVRSRWMIEDCYFLPRGQYFRRLFNLLYLLFSVVSYFSFFKEPGKKETRQEFSSKLKTNVVCESDR